MKTVYIRLLGGNNFSTVIRIYNIIMEDNSSSSYILSIEDDLWPFTRIRKDYGFKLGNNVRVKVS